MNLETLIREVNPTPADTVPGPESAEARAILEAIGDAPSRHRRSRRRQAGPWARRVAVVAVAAVMLVVFFVPLPHLSLFNRLVTPAKPSTATNVPTLQVRTQLAELKGSDTVTGDLFGDSVAISGATVVVGAWGHAGEAGRAYLFTETATGWNQVAELKGSDTVGHDLFGYSVAVSGTTVVVGAFGTAKGAGRAYVFTETQAGWKQAAELRGSDTVAGDNFGYSVAISGTTVVVGAQGHAKHVGRAYVFTKTATGWKQTAELKGSVTVGYDAFGDSVAVSGTTVVVGAYGTTNGAPQSDTNAKSAGRAYVFTKAANGWHQVADLKGSHTVASIGFGYSVAISGTTVVVGAGSPRGANGQVYVFTKTATGWRRVAELNRAVNSVATSGSDVVVGVPIAWSMSTASASVFTKAPTGWRQTAELKVSQPADSPVVYVSVAISGTTVVVGQQTQNAGRVYIFSTTAPKPPPIGAQLAELNVAGEFAVSGSTIVVGYDSRVHVFAKTAAGWRPTAELNGFEPGGIQSVAISGTTIVVGGHGRVYVFTKKAAGWGQVAALKPAGIDSGPLTVAISGSTILVGSVDHYGAFVFTKTAAGWRQTALLLGHNGYNDTVQLWDPLSLAVSGNTAVVGTSRWYTYVFTKTASGWKQAAELKAPYEDAGSVAVSGTTIVVGWDQSSGAVGVFTKTATGWKQTTELKGSDIGQDPPVAISGAVVVVGSPYGSSPRWVQDQDAGRPGVHIHQDGGRLEAGTGAEGRRRLRRPFADSVALSGTTVVIGAPNPFGPGGSGRLYVYQG